MVGAATDLVDGQRVPDKRREGAAPDLRLRHLRDVGKDEVHGNAADEGAEAAGDQRGARRGPNGLLGIGAARGAGKAVGVAGRECDAARRRSRPGSVVAGSLARGQGAELENGAWSRTTGRMGLSRPGVGLPP